MSKNEVKRSKYALSSDAMVNEFLTQGQSRITTKLFTPKLLGKFEDEFEKDACEWTKDEIRTFIKKISVNYTKSTCRNHLNVFRNYRIFMRDMQKEERIPKSVRIADDVITESEMLANLFFKKFSVIHHTTVDKAISYVYQNSKESPLAYRPMEKLIWIMCFYFAPTLKELVNMKADQIEVEYIDYSKDEQGNSQEKKISTTMDKVEYKIIDTISFIKAEWKTEEGRVIDLMKPDNDNSHWKLGHANLIINTIAKISTLTTKAERLQKYIPAAQCNNFILRNQIRTGGKVGVVDGKRVVGEVFSENRIPAMLANFAQKDLMLSDTISYSDLIYSHILYRICSLHERKSDIMNDSNLLMLKNVGLVKGGKIDESVIDEILNEYGYEEDFLEEASATEDEE